MRTFIRIALVAALLCLCGCIRTSQQGTQDTTTETTTKTTEIREEYHDGQVIPLRTEIISQEISQEQARWESQRETNINMQAAGGFLGSLATGGLTGGGPLLDIGTALLGIFGGKKVYDKVRDAPPRRPAPAAASEGVAVRREEEK